VALLLIVLCAAALILLVRLTGTPALGGSPTGPDDGGTPLAIATDLGGEVGAALLHSDAAGAAVLVSEEDLTTLAATDNPDPRTFSDLQVRARGGQLWLSAGTHLGPLPVLVTARVTLDLHPGGAITAAVQEIDVGDQVIPGFLRSALVPRGSAALSLSPLLNGSELSDFGLKCLAVVPQRGVELGFHAPLANADPGYCASHPLAAGATTA
jgi:hypothetical protein